MKDEQRQNLEIVVIVLLIVFLAIYAALMFAHYLNYQIRSLRSTTSIIFKQPSLKVFSYSDSLNTYPDKVELHYPYFLIIKPDRIETTIYNIQTKEKEKTLKQALLDYSDEGILYNNNGYHTYFKGKDIGVFCDSGYIVSKEKILCITRLDKSSSSNKLVSINPQTLTTHTLLSSQNVLTAIFAVNDITYVGEYDFNTNKSYVFSNGQTAQAPDLINAFYVMNSNVYAASFKSSMNKQVESYDEIILKDKGISMKQIGKGEIVFSK